MSFYKNKISLGPKTDFAKFAERVLSKRKGVKTSSYKEQNSKIASSDEYDNKEEEEEEEEEEDEDDNNNEEEDEDEDKKCMAENSSSDVKEAKKDKEESSDQLDVEPLHQEGESEEASKVNDKNKEAKNKNETKKAKAKKQNKKAKKENKEESSDQLDVEPLHQEGESEEGSKVNGKKKESNSYFKTVKVAKLNNKTRELLRDYWKTVFPEDYVEYMLQEK